MTFVAHSTPPQPKRNPAYDLGNFKYDPLEITDKFCSVKAF